MDSRSLSSSDRSSMGKAVRRSRGFTLIEALISLIMFGVIMTSLSFAFSTVMKAQTGSEAHQDENGSVRVVFDALKRDIQAGYASATDPSSVFIGNASSTGTGQNVVSSPGLLTLSTASYRITADELNTSSGSVQNTSSIGNNNGSATPQSGTQLVRYELDSGTGQLTRAVVTVPNLQLVNAPTAGDPASVLATGIVSVTFQYWDPNQSGWQDTWDYEQSAQTASTGTGASGATGASTPTSAGASGSNSTTAANTTFPSAVQVTIVKLDSHRQPVSYSTTFPVTASQPFVDPSKQTATAGGAGGAGGSTPATGN